VNQSEVDRIFDAHEPTDEATALAHEQVRQLFKDVAKTLSNLPAGRERSIVLTKLEEASFFAHAAIAREGIG
jgi:hypothetical protein